MRHFLVPTLLSLAIAATDSPAWAAPPSAAETLYREGLALSRDAKNDPAKYEAAILKFRASFELDPHPVALFACAVAEERAGHDVDALHHFRLVLRMPGLAPGDARDAKGAIEKLSAHVATLMIDAPTGAQIAIDGVPVEASAPPSEALDLLAGHHAVEARLQGRSVSHDVDAVGGSVQQVRFEFPPPAPVPAPPPAPPTALASGAPAARTAPPSGQHPSSPPSSEGSGTRTIVFFSFAGAAVAVGGIGLGFTLAASNAGTSAGTGGPSSYSCALSSAVCQQFGDAKHAQARDTNIATGMYVGAGVLIATAFGALILWPNQTSQIGFVPMLGNGIAGLGARGEF